jgi:hypothetical protein
MFVMHCSVLSAQTGNGITISNFKVETVAGSPSTLTFNVQWTPLANKAWSDTAWVFVDYNTAGAMTRLPLVLNEGGNTLTATSAPGVGRVMEVSGNTNGVWVVGNARNAISGSFSATVQLLAAATATLHGACVYALNYPPLGQYGAIDKIKFTGTPPFKVTFEGNDTPVTVDKAHSQPYTFTGEPIKSFTDLSLAPGTFACGVPAEPTLTASAAGYCVGTPGVTFTLTGTDVGAVYHLCRDNVPLPGATVTGTGNADAFPASYKTGTYNVQVVGSQVFCAATFTSTQVVVEVPLPTVPVEPVPGGNTCAGTGITFTSNIPADATGLAWTGTSISGEGTLTTTATTTAGPYTAQVRAYVTADGATCFSEYSTAASATIYALPSISPTTASSTTKVSQSVSMQFTTQNATTVTTSGEFPALVAPSFASNNCTVSGTPSGTGTFQFQITPTDANTGCTGSPATGTIVVNPKGPFSATTMTKPSEFIKTTTAWVFGSQTWSDYATSVPSDCTDNASDWSYENTVWSYDNSVKQYAIANGRAYMSWGCATATAPQICPSASGWRLPTKEDIEYFGALPWEDYWLSSDYIEDWCRGGLIYPDGLHDADRFTWWWTATARDDNTAFLLCMLNDIVVSFSLKYAGVPIRCVK